MPKALIAAAQGYSLLEENCSSVKSIIHHKINPLFQAEKEEEELKKKK